MIWFVVELFVFARVGVFRVDFRGSVVRLLFGRLG